MNISACGTRTTFQNDSAADLSKTDLVHKCGVRHVSTLWFVAGMRQGHLHAVWGLPSRVRTASHLFTGVAYYCVPLQDPCTAVACCRQLQLHVADNCRAWTWRLLLDYSIENQKSKG